MGNSGAGYHIELSCLISDNNAAISSTAIAPFQSAASSLVDADMACSPRTRNEILALSDFNCVRCEVDYRVQFTGGANTVWSDPRIKDVGQ